MSVDIRTLAFVLGITHFIQIIVFSYQYHINKNFSGIACWLLWSIAEVLGFASIFVRQIFSTSKIPIFFQNFFIILGVIFLYIGIIRFFEKRENRTIVFSIITFYFLTMLYYLFIDDQILIRSYIFNITLFVISFMTAHALFYYRPASLVGPANFNAVFFLIHGCFFIFRTLMIIKDPSNAIVFLSSPLNVATYVDALVFSILWTFVLVVMINQRLSVGLAEANKEMETIFSTSPDAAIISRMSDGLIVNVNDGFNTLSGYTRDEVIGKSSLDINIWKNREDRETMINKISKKGFVENFETEFQRKDGSLIIGLVSAKVIDMQNIPYIISITRDISERKQFEEQLQAMSIKDDLTSLYNRRGFFTLAGQQMKVAERTKKNMLLFFVDLDKMKHINDALGHQEGDKALIDIATVLKEAFRESDIIGRMGGDEFSVLAIDTTDETREVLTKRLYSILDDYNKPQGRNYQLSLSIGIAHYDPEKPSSLDELMAQADDLMYEEKRRKRE
jgi:diguanylate cyclase (GGDEF)-like protein/PAS domain S-box-containing protein